MCRLLLLLSALLLAAAAGSADDRSDKWTQALSEACQEAARKVRPSIARVLVSRSPDYHTAPHWGLPLDPEHPGKLGRFDATAAANKVPKDARNRARILRTIAQLDLSDPDAVPESYGSGIVVDRSGLILTTAHVVKNATKIYVRLPGKRGSWANIHASDPRSDLAVLKLLDPPKDLVELPFGDGGGVQTGKFVISIANSYAPGFPGNDDPTAEYGIVSNLRQRIEGRLSEMDRDKKNTLHHYGTLIQTDAGTKPGCSGGVLLDFHGKVLGMITALAAVRGDKPGGFAIPFDANTRRIVEVLKRGEEVEYGFLGVVLEDRAMGGGVRISMVSPGSPAARAGLQSGDRITRINNREVRENDDLFLLIGIALAGNQANIEIRRDRGFGPAVLTKTVRLAKYLVPGPIIAANRPPARFGLRVDHTSILGQREFIRRDRGEPPEGVMIREVVKESPAHRANFDEGKIITHVNGVPVTHPAEYYREVAKAGKSVELTYLTSSRRPEKVVLEEK